MDGQSHQSISSASTSPRSSSGSLRSSPDERNEAQIPEPAEKSTSPGARRKSRLSKPILVEISSDEDEKRETVARGAARGLNLRNVLPPPTPASTENLHELNDDLTHTTHVTRASRSGRVPVDYDMKYHPMDEVTRPKRAAARRAGSRSASLKREHSPGTSSGEQTMDYGDDDDDDSDDGDKPQTLSPLTLMRRSPDPRATRRSARDHKLVNYSKKYHPQDHSLPGYRHRALQHAVLTSSHLRVQKKRKKSKASRQRPDLIPDIDLFVDDIIRGSQPALSKEHDAKDTQEGVPSLLTATTIETDPSSDVGLEALDEFHNRSRSPLAQLYNVRTSSFNAAAAEGQEAEVDESFALKSSFIEQMDITEQRHEGL